MGLVQERWHPDSEEHLDALANGIRMAAAEGARLVCLQELTLSPYFAALPDGPDGLERTCRGHAGPAPPDEMYPRGWRSTQACTSRRRSGRPTTAVAPAVRTRPSACRRAARGGPHPQAAHPGHGRLPRGSLLPPGCRRVPGRAVEAAGDGASRPAGTNGSRNWPGPTRWPAPRCWSIRRPSGVSRTTPGSTPAAVAAGDRRQRHRERHVHGRGEQHRQRAGPLTMPRSSRSTGRRSSATPTAGCWCRRPATRPRYIVADLDLDARDDWLELFPFLARVDPTPTAR